METPAPLSEHENEPLENAWNRDLVLWGAGGCGAILIASVWFFLLFHTKWVIAAGVVLAAAYGLVLWLGMSRKAEKGQHARRLAPSTDRAYLGALIVLGLSFCFLFGPGTVPDESYHFTCTYKYSDIVLGQTATDDRIAIRSVDLPLMNSLPGDTVMDREDYDTALAELEPFSSESGVTEMKTSSSYSWTANLPQLKWAPVLGLLIGRLLNLGAFPLFYLGRLFNLAYYIALCWLAVRLTPVCKSAFRIVSLLPMPMHLAASYSYDAAGIGLMLVLGALLLRAVCQDGRISTRLLVAIPVMAALAIPAKTIYLPVMLIVLFIPNDRFSSKRRAVLYKTGCFGAALLALAAIRLATILSMVSTASDGSSGRALSHRGSETGYFYTLGQLVTHPLATIQLYIDTFQAQGNLYLSTMWGGNLGWFQPTLVAPQAFGYCFYGVLAASTLSTPEDKWVGRPALRAMLILVFVLSVLLAMLAMATSWTFDTETVIQGVQGRYFLPVLPLLLVALRGRSAAFHTPVSLSLVLFTTATSIVYILNLYGTILGL